MTRYAIDALTAIRLVREGSVVPEEIQLVAPKSLQTHAMSQLYYCAVRGAFPGEIVVSLRIAGRAKTLNTNR